MEKLFLIVLVDKACYVVVEPLPVVVVAVFLIEKVFAVEYRIGAGGKIHIKGGYKHVAVSVEESDRAFSYARFQLRPCVG